MQRDVVNNYRVDDIEDMRKSIAYDAFREMKANGLKFCIWKSIDRFVEGARGETDFDILVHEDGRNSLNKYLAGHGWIYLSAEPWRRFPGVEDYVKYIGGGKFIHLHAHYRLVMGESRVKSLELPLEELYLDNIAGDKIPYVKPEIEFIVFIIRLSLKITAQARIAVLLTLWKTPFDNVLSEYQHLHSRVSLNELNSVLDKKEFNFLDKNIILSVYDDINNYTWLNRLKVRRSVRRYRRYSGLSSVIVKNYRKLLYYYYGVGKSLARGGVSIAICGADGSGKSSVVDAVVKNLGHHFRVNHVYMGGSPYSRGFVRSIYRILVFPIYIIMYRLLHLLSMGALGEMLKARFYTYECMMIKGEKQRRFEEARKKLLKGEVVIFERFPLFEGYGDAGMGQCYGRSVQDLFFPGYTPDIILFLDVSPEEAANRKPDHDPEVIKRKVHEFRRYFLSNKNNNIFRLDSGEPFDIVLEQSMRHIVSGIHGAH